MPARVLGQLLIDLSWSSSHLEGNSKSLLDTKELFERGEQTGPMDEDSLMLPNHKNAIESIIDRVRQIRNPVEVAFFLWINVAYLQPFADDNKRTSRISANMPLKLYNCAPLSFLDVERTDYATAMLGVYEQCKVAAAVELFEFIYRRSIQKYSVLRASFAVPDPLRARYRQALNEFMQFVVLYGRTLEHAFSEVPVAAADLAALRVIANTELDHLEPYNCARYNLARGITQRWIDAGRPR